MFPKDVSLPTEHPSASVSDHEVYYSFDNDNDALLFENWMLSEGWELFNRYRWGVCE